MTGGVKLYLVRHGDALARGGTIATDADRPLSTQGEDEARSAARLLSRMDPSIALVLTSPAVRTAATGRFIANGLPSRPECRTSDQLKPGARVEAIVKEVIAARKESIVAVGHQPDLGTLIAWLVANQGPASLVIPSGTVACIEMQPDLQLPRASLRWLAPPDLVRQLLPE